MQLPYSMHVVHPNLNWSSVVAGMVFSIAAFGSPLPAVREADRTKTLKVRRDCLETTELTAT